MTTDLEDLLRTTLAERAAQVHRPAPYAPVARRVRPAAVGMLAAVAVTALAVTASVVFADGSDDGGTDAAGALRTTCTAAPAQAATVLAGQHRMTYDGQPVAFQAATPDGTVLGTVAVGTNATELVRVPLTGAAAPLLAVPADRMITRVDADDEHAVVTSSPNVSGVGDSPDPLDRITVLDLRTGASTDVLAALPAGYPHTPIGGRGAVLQDGVAYWAAARGSDATSGPVLSYDIATGHYAEVGSTATAEVDRDVRGVGWPGGSVTADDAPTGLPAFFDADGRYQPVYSDGSLTAWQTAGSSVVHVRDADGGTATWRVQVAGRERFAPSLSAVTGHDVVFDLDDTGDGAYLLDTRTGAVLGLGAGVDAAYPALVTHHGVPLIHSGSPGTSRLDAATLPTLAC